MRRDEQQHSSSSEGDNHDIGTLNDLTEVNDQDPVDDLSPVDDDEIAVKEEKEEETPAQEPQRETPKPLSSILRRKKRQCWDTLEPVPHLPRSAQNRKPVTRFEDEHPKLGHLATTKCKVRTPLQEEWLNCTKHLHKKITEKGGGYVTKNGYSPPNGSVKTKRDCTHELLAGMRFKQLTEILQSGSLAQLKQTMENQYGLKYEGPDDWQWEDHETGTLAKMANLMEHFTDQKTRTVEDWHPAYLSTQANASDNPTWQ